MFVLEPFQPSDLLGVMRLAARTLSESYPFEFFLQMARLDTCHFRVAREVETGRLVGAIIAVRQPACEGSVLLITVDPAHQGQGLGRQLLRDAQRALALRDVRTLQLEVRPENQRAIEFYEREGFTVAKWEEHVYRDGSDALLMTKPLL